MMLSAQQRAADFEMHPFHASQTRNRRGER